MLTIFVLAEANFLATSEQGKLGTSAKFSPRQQVENFPQLVKRKAVYTEGAGPVGKCTGQCTLEGSVQGGG